LEFPNCLAIIIINYTPAISIEWTEWGRCMRDLNIGNQRCGGGGYRRKKAVWAKEDAEYGRLGKENP
jgi:hypothetical protein